MVAGWKLTRLLVFVVTIFFDMTAVAEENPVYGRWTVLNGKCDGQYTQYSHDRIQVYRVHWLSLEKRSMRKVNYYKVNWPFVSWVVKKKWFAWMEREEVTMKFIDINVMKQVYRKVVHWWDESNSSYPTNRFKNGEIIGVLEQDERGIIRHFGIKEGFAPIVWRFLVYRRCP
jgi:hypothetical protein